MSMGMAMAKEQHEHETDACRVDNKREKGR